MLLATTKKNIVGTCPYVPMLYIMGWPRHMPLGLGTTHGRDTALPLVHCCSHLSCGGDDGGVAVLVFSSSVTGIVLIHGRGGVLLLLSTAATGGGPDTEAAAAAAAVRRLRPRRPESPARRTLQRLAQHATRGTDQQPPFLLCCLCLVSRSAQHQ